MIIEQDVNIIERKILNKNSIEMRAIKSGLLKITDEFKNYWIISFIDGVG